MQHGDAPGSASGLVGRRLSAHYTSGPTPYGAGGGNDGWDASSLLIAPRSSARPDAGQRIALAAPNSMEFPTTSAALELLVQDLADALPVLAVRGSIDSTSSASRPARKRDRRTSRRDAGSTALLRSVLTPLSCAAS